MNVLWFIVAVHTGILAAGFGLAGLLQFQELENRKRSENAFRTGSDRDQASGHGEFVFEYN